MIVSKKVKNIILICIMVVITNVCFCVGIFALKKSMELSVNFNVQPHIRCEIEMKKAGETEFTPMFSNLSNEEFISPSFTFNEMQNKLTFNGDFYNTVGAGFELKIFNYNTKHSHS